MNVLQRRLESLGLYQEPAKHVGEGIKITTEGVKLSTIQTERQRPVTILAMAQSLDGAIGVRKGGPLILSSPQSFQLTHYIRNACDGILVGIGTVLADGPSLTTRLAVLDHHQNQNTAQRNARPVIVDSRLECPVGAKFMSRDRNPIILTSTDCKQRNCTRKEEEVAREARRQALIDAGATVVDVPHSCLGSCSLSSSCSNPARVDLVKALEYLYTNLDIKSIMIEGGANIIQDCLSSDLIIDELIITIAPLIVGRSPDAVFPFSTSLLSFSSEGSEARTNVQLSSVEWAQFGPDICMFSKCTKGAKIRI